MDIGKVIKEHRIKKELTQEELAQELFVSRQLISRWENGNSYPDLIVLMKLSDFFNLSLDELMRGDNKMTKKLNFSNKKKEILTSIITLLALSLVGLGYFFWSDRSVQLKPSDIEITSIKIEKNPSVEVTDTSSNKEIILSDDVSYIIKYKVKKSFFNLNTGYYFDLDQDNIYLDMRGNNSLFSLKDEQTFIISSDSKLYTDNKNLEIDEDFIKKTIQGKDIRILDINSVTPQDTNLSINSWLLIKKEDLR